VRLTRARGSRGSRLDRDGCGARAPKKEEDGVAKRSCGRPAPPFATTPMLSVGTCASAPLPSAQVSDCQLVLRFEIELAGSR
jgi:hypothetical protein